MDVEYDLGQKDIFELHILDFGGLAEKVVDEFAYLSHRATASLARLNRAQHTHRDHQDRGEEDRGKSPLEHGQKAKNSQENSISPHQQVADASAAPRCRSVGDRFPPLRRDPPDGRKEQRPTDYLPHGPLL